MYTKSAESWSKFCQVAGKPFIELTELNAKSLSKIAEQVRSLQESVQNRRPEDFISANMSVMGTVGAALADYNRKAAEILVNGFTETGKIWSDVLHETCSQMPCGMTAGKTGEHSGNTRQK